MADAKPTKRTRHSPAHPEVARRELAEQLQTSLKHLQKFVSRPYTGDSSLDRWPTMHSIEDLVTLVAALARALGVRKTAIEGSVMRRIDRRYAKMGLMAFVNGLVRKIEAVPLGPVTRIRKELETCSDLDRMRKLLLICDLLERDDWELTVDAGKLCDLAPLLLELSGGVVRTAIAEPKPSTIGDIDFSQSKLHFTKVFALAGFLELQRHHLLWKLKWHEPIRHLATWPYMLRDPSLDSRLRKVLINPNPTPDLRSASDKSAQERAKKRRYRQKKARR